MKITALIPDNLVSEVKKLTHGKNITDSLVIALNQWASGERIKKLNQVILNKPIEFHQNYSASTIRNLNRG